MTTIRTVMTNITKYEMTNIIIVWMTVTTHLVTTIISYDDLNNI